MRSTISIFHFNGSPKTTSNHICIHKSIYTIYTIFILSKLCTSKRSSISTLLYIGDTEKNSLSRHMHKQMSQDPTMIRTHIIQGILNMALFQSCALL